MLGSRAVEGCRGPGGGAGRGGLVYPFGGRYRLPVGASAPSRPAQEARLKAGAPGRTQGLDSYQDS